MLSAVGHATDGVDGFEVLGGAVAVATFTIEDNTFAIVASKDDDGVQIMDVSNPDTPVIVSSLVDQSSSSYSSYVSYDQTDHVLKDVTGVAMFTRGASTFALITSHFDDGVQIVDVSDPRTPKAVSNARDGRGKFDVLNQASGVSTFTVGESTYAIVVSFGDNGFQIIDVNNSSSLVAVGSGQDERADTDGKKFTELDGASGVATFVINDSNYAIVASFRDHGVQLVDLSDPTNPLAVWALRLTASTRTTLEQLDHAQRREERRHVHNRRRHVCHRGEQEGQRRADHRRE